MTPRVIKLLLWVAFTAAVKGIGVAEAALVTWNLNDVVFTDGGLAHGFFSIDISTNEVTAWDISTYGGSSPRLAFTYTPANTGAGTQIAPGNLLYAIGFSDQTPERESFHSLRFTQFNPLLNPYGGNYSIVQFGGCTPPPCVTGEEDLILGPRTGPIYRMVEYGKLIAVPEVPIIVFLSFAVALAAAVKTSMRWL